MAAIDLFNYRVALMFFKTEHPILTGQISLETGFSLAKCEKYLSDLEEEGYIYKLNEKDLVARKLDIRFNAWLPKISRIKFLELHLL